MIHTIVVNYTQYHRQNERKEREDSKPSIRTNILGLDKIGAAGTSALFIIRLQLRRLHKNSFDVVPRVGSLAVQVAGFIIPVVVSSCFHRLKF